MKVLRRVVLAGGLLGCGGAQTPPPVAAPIAAAPGDEVLGVVDGVKLTRSDLSADVGQRLRDFENEAEQRKFHLLWVAFEDAVAQRLLTKEAARRKITVEELRKTEIEAKVRPPSDEEVRTLYDANQDAIGVPFEIAAPKIRQQLTEDRLNEQERAFVETLRQGSDVRYALPTPSLPRVAMELDDAPALGPKDARVTLVEFADFQCPYCSRARSVLKRLAELYPDSLRIVFRDFPLQQHARARPAAEAAHCAFEQGKFWPYHDLLFANTQALSNEDLKRYAQELKLDSAAFDGCLTSGRAQTAVKEAEAAGRRMGVEGTPAIYINGMKLIGLLPLPLMQALIDHELGR